jgi:hypothetical protein
VALAHTYWVQSLQCLFFKTYGDRDAVMLTVECVTESRHPVAAGGDRQSYKE